MADTVGCLGCGRCLPGEWIEVFHQASQRSQWGGLGERRRQGRCQDELRLADTLAAGAVKQDRVAVGFPDCGELHAAGSVKAEENAASLAAANQDPFGYLKGADLEFILLADRVLYICAEVFQVVNVHRLGRHWQRKLLR